MKKFITAHISVIFWLILLCLWEFCIDFLPHLITPTPTQIIKAFFIHHKDILHHALSTLKTTFVGTSVGVVLAYLFACLMDRFYLLFRIFYPFFILLQTIPTIILAPILVLYLGYNDAPKVVLVTLSTAFPVLLSMIEGLKSCDKNYIILLETFNAKKLDILLHFKLPNSLPYFFAGLKVSISYAYISAVVSEWVGGFVGLGVLILNSKKLFEYDLMFATTLLVSAMSILSVKCVGILENYIIKWRK